MIGFANWQRAFARLKQLVGADDNRVLAVEVLLAPGDEGEFYADQLLLRELDAIAGTTARTVNGAAQ